MELWLELLQQQLNGSKSIAAIARECGLNRSTVSAIVNRIPTSPYVNGRASTANIEARVIAVFGRYVCPHMTARDGRETWVSGEECRSYSNCDPPTHNRLAVEHWQACQGCERRPPELTQRAYVPRGPKVKVAASDQQMAIDI